MENDKINNGIEEENTASVNMNDYFKLCLDKWYWFAASIVICLFIGVIYLMKTTPSYQREALIQIRDDKHGGSLNNEMFNSFTDLGMFSSSADIYNELVAIKSPRLLSQVVKNLDLNTSYTFKKGMKTMPLYGASLPLTATFVDADKHNLGMVIKIVEGDSIATLKDFSISTPGGVEEFDGEVKFNMERIDTLSTPIGRVVMRPNAKYISREIPEIDIDVNWRSPESMTTALGTAIQASLANEHATVIKLEIVDTSAERAENILDNLIEVYNQSWVDDKNRMARATSRFINQRLVSLEGELSDVDSDISSFKSQNLVPDVDAASSLYLQQASRTSDEILELNNQLSMARYVRDYLSNPTHATALMPANSGTGTSSIDNQINEYNRLMIERNKLVASSSENHPRVSQYDRSLAEMRDAVLKSIDTQIMALNTAIKNLQSSESHATARIAANPTQAKYLLSVGRQQKVKESLYLFLLQKREENELSQTFAPYNTRIIQDATGTSSPVAPRGAMVMAAAFLLGILIPAGTFYLIEMFNTKVRGRRDIDAIDIPFLGEVPYDGQSLKFRRSKDSDKGIIVAHGKDDPSNEAFRMLRSSLEFMNRSDSNKAKIVMVTSAIPGSGKTYISMNLATAISLKKKKVLLIDLDLRRHAMSSQLAESQRRGVSAILAGDSDIEPLIAHNIDGHEGLDFLAAGAIPPNPAELMGSPMLSQLMEYARSHYDIVILDCPPTEPVEDARSIAPYADMTIYIVRIGNLDRSFLPKIVKMNKEKRYPRMSVVLNGTPITGAFAYSYSYSYKSGSRK